MFSSEPESPEFASSTAIQRALGAAGLSCHSYQSVPKESREPSMKDAADVGECAIDGENPRLVIWTDNAQKDSWAEASQQVGCAMAEGFGAPTFNYVAGDRWSVSDTSQRLAEKIADAIGGQAVHKECEQA